MLQSSGLRLARLGSSARLAAATAPLQRQQHPQLRHWSSGSHSAWPGARRGLSQVPLSVGAPARGFFNLQKIKDRFFELSEGRKQVGEDPAGNRYFWKEVDGKTRRFVEYKDPSLPDMHSMHILWYQWIRFQRTEPPTPEEVAKYDQDFAAYKARVKAADEREAENRLREMLEKELNDDVATVDDLIRDNFDGQENMDKWAHENDFDSKDPAYPRQR